MPRSPPYRLFQRRYREDGDVLRSLLVVAGREVTAEHRWLSEQRERVRRHARAANLLRRRAIVAQVHAVGSKSAEPFECLRLRAPVLEVGKGDTASPARLAQRADHVEIVRVLEGEPLEQNGVDQREHGGVHTDAERERDDRDGRIPSLLDDQMKRKPQVSQHDEQYVRSRTRVRRHDPLLLMITWRARARLTGSPFAVRLGKPL